jgi:hypothetical protein
LTVLPIYSSNIFYKNNKVNLLNSYINLKSIVINNILKSQSININLYKNNSITSYLDDLSLNKIAKLNSNLYPLEANYLYNNLITQHSIYNNNNIKLIQKFNYNFLDSIESPQFNLILKFNKILSKFYLINGTFFKKINTLSIDKKTIKQFKKYIRLLKKILKKIKKKDKKINKNKSQIINLSKIIKLKTIRYLIIMKLVLFKNSRSFKNKKI